jgi:hypothetical protein
MIPEEMGTVPGGNSRFSRGLRGNLRQSRICSPIVSNPRSQSRKVPLNLESFRFAGRREERGQSSLRSALACGLFLATVATVFAERNPAPTPPMGWNSYDAYGLTIGETEFRDNVIAMGPLKQFGWSYAVIDEGWYMENPLGKDLAAHQYVFDKHGLLVPVASRFPSAAGDAGFKPLADWVHGQGFKFGIHIVRGIPKPVVHDNLPIAGSRYRTADAADTSETCPWDDGNYGIRDNAAGQAYYDSMLRLYARWGVDFLKVDCISDHPYRITEIRQIARAIAKTGRPIVLSLSPGPTALRHGAEIGKYAQMWRIADDHWDFWGDGARFGVRDAFDPLEKWAPFAKPGNWPDADMFPWGWLAPHPGWGDPRQSRETQDEQRTEFTLWAFARSPMIVGANLTRLDDFTRSLLTNEEIVAVNQKGTDNHPVKDLPAGFDHVRVWQATEGGARTSAQAFALFNLGDKPVTLHFKWEQLGYRGKGDARSLYDGAVLNSTSPVEITLPAHGCGAYRVGD